MTDKDEDPPEIAFRPVPSRTGRRDGWTEERQRAFIAALARCGSVSAAAKQVGKSASGAYRLCDREGAEDFARAWDEAVEMGRDAVLDNVIDRAMHGGWVPVVRRGRIVRMEYRPFDRLTLAVLHRRDGAPDIQDNRRIRRFQAEYRRELREIDRRREAERAEAARWRAEYDAEIERLRAMGRQRVPRIHELWRRSAPPASIQRVRFFTQPSVITYQSSGSSRKRRRTPGTS
jgi:hypothetical protein